MLGFVSVSADPPAAPEAPAGPDACVEQLLASESSTIDCVVLFMVRCERVEVGCEHRSRTKQCGR
jgi:hypothetical protein